MHIKRDLWTYVQSHGWPWEDILLLIPLSLSYTLWAVYRHNVIFIFYHSSVYLSWQYELPLSYSTWACICRKRVRAASIKRITTSDLANRGVWSFVRTSQKIAFAEAHTPTKLGREFVHRNISFTKYCSLFLTRLLFSSVLLCELTSFSSKPG